MKAQIPAEGIMRKGDYGDSVWYEISCDCGQPDHIHTVEVEADDFNVTVNIYTKQHTDMWSEPFKPEYRGKNEFLYTVSRTFKNCINGLIRRVSLTWNIWARGYVEYEVTTVMNQQEALNYAEALKKAAKDVQNFRDQRKQSDKK
jgi:hypothetical protein